MSFIQEKFDLQNVKTQEPIIKNRKVILLTLLERGIYGDVANPLINAYDKTYLPSHLQGINYYNKTSKSLEHYLVNIGDCEVFKEGMGLDIEAIKWNTKNTFNKKLTAEINVDKLWKNGKKYSQILKNNKLIELNLEKNVSLLKDVPKTKTIIENESEYLKIVINGRGSFDLINPLYQKPINVNLEDRKIGGLKADKVVDFITDAILQSDVKKVKVTLNSCMSGRVRESDGTSLAGYIKEMVEKNLEKEGKKVQLDVKGVNGFMLPFACEDKNGKTLAINNLKSDEMQFPKYINADDIIAKQEGKYLKNHINPTQSKVCNIL
jgi:hypothetical protein